MHSSTGGVLSVTRRGARTTRTGGSRRSSPRTTPRSRSTRSRRLISGTACGGGRTGALDPLERNLGFHSFFSWAEAEDLVEVDPSRKIRRPPKRKPDVYRPSLDELRAGPGDRCGARAPAVLLMEGAGLRRSEVLACRWEDLDLFRGRVASSEGAALALAPHRSRRLGRASPSYRELQPEPDDHVFRVEIEVWVNERSAMRRRKDPKNPAREQALWRLTRRICKRAGVRLLSPTSYGMASQTDSSARAAEISSRFSDLWATRGRTRRRRTRTTSNSTTSPMRSDVAEDQDTHKRRQKWRQNKTRPLRASNRFDGGGGNRTRVRGRTGQSIYERSSP